VQTISIDGVKGEQELSKDISILLPLIVAQRETRYPTPTHQNPSKRQRQEEEDDGRTKLVVVVVVMR
jgi:hypothetical protein